MSGPWPGPLASGRAGAAACSSVPRGMPQTGDVMTRIWPLPCEGLGNSSYLAEVADGLALAGDPGRDPRPYLGLAAAHGLRGAFTADTHVHAAFVSGGRDLAPRGARRLAPSPPGLAVPPQAAAAGRAPEPGRP